ncbi:hypothetical protein JAAARDRAFT_261611 [Jaapia argillacea MUCL 33604]|uniref:Uncharacterized protein n=1 Tax=Jaapia argillacea MUCL 33604 TaxID=933084 RepID=A0A067PWL9_9AGAM|nr:hypothetical protein JAAARDRAFT_261611 [Jaapia argillacea MUCL 33604]
MIGFILPDGEGEEEVEDSGLPDEESSAKETSEGDCDNSDLDNGSEGSEEAQVTPDEDSRRPNQLYTPCRTPSRPTSRASTPRRPALTRLTRTRPDTDAGSSVQQLPPTPVSSRRVKPRKAWARVEDSDEESEDGGPPSPSPKTWRL